MAVTEAGVEDREVVAEVLSRAGLGTLQSADLAEPRPPGSSGLLWLSVLARLWAVSSQWGMKILGLL